MTKFTDYLLKPNLIFSILKNGVQSLSYVQLGDDLEKLFKVYGKTEHDAEISDHGYFHYDHGLRFSYKDDEIDEIAINFISTESKYPINVENSLIELEYIDQNTKIHDFLMLLSVQNISWKSKSQPHSNAFSILTEGGISVIFHLDDGCLYRMAVRKPDAWGWYQLKNDLAELIIPKLEAYRKGYNEDGMCIASWVLSDNEKKEHYTEEDQNRLKKIWLGEIDHMLMAFRGILDYELGLDDEYIQQGIDKFAKHFQHFWD